MDFSTQEIFNESWATLRKHLALSVALTFVLFLAMICSKFIPLVGNLIWAPFQLGYMRCLYQMKNGKDFGSPDFFWGWADLNRLGHVILLQVLSLIFVVFGCLLLILPGIWVSVALSLGMPLFLFQSEPDSIAAIRESLALVKGRWWRICGFLGILGVILLVGMLIFGVGVLVATPLVTLMSIHLAERLKSLGATPSEESGFAPIGDPT
jgi:hypothetical protein